MRGLSPVAASGGHSSSRCAGLSLSRPLLLWSTGSRRAGSVVVAHGPSCSAACGIFPDQGSNPCRLHWQADSQPLRHQGSPICDIFFGRLFFFFYMSGIVFLSYWLFGLRLPTLEFVAYCVELGLGAEMRTSGRPHPDEYSSGSEVLC